MHPNLIALLILSAPPQISSGVPGAITDFCEVKFQGKMAPKNAPFNATDNIEQNLPMRRLVGFSVTSARSYIWYEHGGRGYHQHLIQFSTIHPATIEHSFVFSRTKHKDIYDLLADKAFLNSHRSDESEL